MKYVLILGPTKTYQIYSLLRNSSGDVIHIPLPHTTCRVALRPMTSDLSTFHEIYLDRDYDIPIDFDPKIIVDAGANVGYASVYFALRFPSARIFAIEPETSNLAMFKMNTAGFPNIQVIEAALWDKHEPVHILNPEAKHYSYQVGKSSADSGAIETVTMLDIFSMISSNVIDIVKMDIEGGEKQVLSHSKEWIKKIKVLIVELHDRHVEGCKAALDSAIGNLRFQPIQTKTKNLFAFRNLDLC